MSRIGKKNIIIPNDTTVSINSENHVVVKGPKGTLENTFTKAFVIENIENKEIKISIKNPSLTKKHNAMWGTTSALLANMIEGVTKGFSKTLNIVGVGYRASLKDNILTLALGYSHPVIMEVPAGITIAVPKPTQIDISGISKELVGQFAALIRNKKLPEPYLGKGILYKDEKIIRKEGKAAGK